MIVGLNVNEARSKFSYIAVLNAYAVYNYFTGF
ncbi:MAG: hypothetical protein K0S32_4522 [Bacteroidetes bacterium]|jgi:hypothetical protein|nr:hypothetical protein [Bacteroidota bacterium]